MERAGRQERGGALAIYGSTTGGTLECNECKRLCKPAKRKRLYAVTVEFGERARTFVMRRARPVVNTVRLPKRVQACIIHSMNSQTAAPPAHSEIPATTSAAIAEPVTSEPMLVLLDAARRIECRLEGALADVALSIAKFQALDVLVTAGEPTRLSALAGSLDCVRSNVTQLADRLESDGLIQRVTSPDDRRAVHAVVTALGRERHAAGAAAIHRLQAELAAQVAPADRESFHRVLSALR